MLADTERLGSWTDELLKHGLITQTGRTRATRYFVPHALLRATHLDRRTTLTRVQPHRLRALILEDLERFPDSGIADVHRRVGPEIPRRTLQRALKELLDGGEVTSTGERRWTRYRLNGMRQGGNGGA